MRSRATPPRERPLERPEASSPVTPATRQVASAALPPTTPAGGQGRRLSALREGVRKHSGQASNYTQGRHPSTLRADVQALSGPPTIAAQGSQSSMHCPGLHAHALPASGLPTCAPSLLLHECDRQRWSRGAASLRNWLHSHPSQQAPTYQKLNWLHSHPSQQAPTYQKLADCG